MAGTADITGNAFADVAYVPKLHLIHPFWVCNQAAPHANQIRIAPLQNFIGHLRVTDIAHCHAGLAITLLNRLRHIRTPPIRQVIGVNLVLDGGIEACRYVKDVHFLLKILQVLQGILQGIPALQKFICADAHKNREERPYLPADFLNHKPCKAGAVLSGAAKLIRTLIGQRGNKLAQQIGMARMDFHRVKPCCLGAFCRFAVFPDNLINFFLL